MKRMQSRTFCFFLVFCIPVLSFAQSPEKTISKTTIQKAQKFFQLGEEAYQETRYEEALQHYRESYALSEEALLLYNMAQCYRLLDNTKEAIWHYRAFLEKDKSDSDYHKLSQKFLEELEETETTPTSLEATNVQNTISPSEPFGKETQTLSLPKKSEENFLDKEKTSKRTPFLKRFLLPAGLATGGLLFGGIALRHQTRTKENLDAGARRVGILLAGSSDLLFLGAGVSFFFALLPKKKSNFSLTLSPLSPNAIVSIQYRRTVEKP